MWNVLRFISLLFLFANISLAQNPSGVSLVITTKNGKTTFRKGEPIPVELRFQSDRTRAVSGYSRSFAPRSFE